MFDLRPRRSFEAKFEYLPALPALRRGVAYYVGHFAQLLPDLPTHAKGNPPGPLVAMHLLGIDDARAARRGVHASSGRSCTPLTYALGRSLGGRAADGSVDAERRGRSPRRSRRSRRACCSTASPRSTSSSRRWPRRSRGCSSRGAVGVVALGCVAAGIAAFFSWVLLAIPAWAVLVVYVRDGRGAAVRLAVGAAAGVRRRHAAARRCLGV